MLTYDVIIAGGGIAGTVAAVAAARQGARTLLLERNQCLGGAATMRGVLTFCGLFTLGEAPKRVVHGIADEILDGLTALDGLGPVTRFRGVFVPFDPEALKRVLDDLTDQTNLEVRFGSQIFGAQREQGRLTEITVADHGGTHGFAASAFVDCTGDGDLASLGGASTRYGNPDGVNLGTLGCRFGGIPADVDIGAEQIIDAVAALQAAPGTVTKDRSVVVRLPGSNDLALYLASADFDPRDGFALSGAERDTRRQAWQYLRAIRSIRGCENAYLVATGPEIGTRESRHLESRRKLLWTDIENRRDHADTIALGAWGAEWHDRQTFESTFEFPPDRASYPIPLACLRSVDTSNLLCAGRLADGDRKAAAAIRVLGTAMATGQAAGTAAALVADRKFSDDVVRTKLREAGAMLRVGT